MNDKIIKSVNTVIKIDGKPLGGQQGAQLSRSMEPIDITNKINGEWAESLAGVKTWRLNCSGIYVLNNKALYLLEDAFLNNRNVEVEINLGGKTMTGQGLIIDFPLNATFNKEFKYNLSLLGVGALMAGG